MLRRAFFRVFFWVVCFSVFQVPIFGLPSLTIWVRAFGAQAAEQIGPHLTQVIDQVSPHFETTIKLCTNPNDPILASIEKLPDNFPIEVIFSDMKSFSGPLNQLVTSTPASTLVLSLSVGIDINPELLLRALEWIDLGAYTVGWKIDSQGNDGTLPGKGWYNTAALYSPICVQWLREHPFPIWIDNGVEGSLLIENQSVPIGGNEEIWLMGAIASENPFAFFVLNTRDVIHSSQKVGTGIDFDAKMKRKTFVANYYIENKFNLTPEKLWNHLMIVQEDGFTTRGSTVSLISSLRKRMSGSFFESEEYVLFQPL